MRRTLFLQTAKSPSTLGDEASIIRDAQANPAQFGPLYEHYVARVYRYCLRRVGSTSDAEDLTSVIFMRAIGNLHSYRGKNGTVAAWLFTIAHNTVANHCRDHKAQLCLDDIADNTLEDGDFLEGMIEAERIRSVAHLIAALPDDQRELLALRIAAGLSIKETASVIGKSEIAVRVAVHRIVQHLRDSYAELKSEDTDER